MPCESQGPGLALLVLLKANFAHIKPLGENSTKSAKKGSPNIMDPTTKTDQALRTLIIACHQAQARGAFTIEEAAVLHRCLSVLVRSNPSTSQIVQSASGWLDDPATANSSSSGSSSSSNSSGSSGL